MIDVIDILFACRDKDSIRRELNNMGVEDDFAIRAAYLNGVVGVTQSFTTRIDHTPDHEDDYAVACELLLSINRERAAESAPFFALT